MSSAPRVLILESNDALRAILFTVLRHQPVEVDKASTAEEALAKVADCDYALLIIDMDLPDNAARIFLNDFREQRPQATTFILAVRDPGSDEPLDPSIVSAVLNKPLEIDTIAEIARECSLVVPLPDDPLPCPPADSDVRSRFERSPYIAN